MKRILILTDSLGLPRRVPEYCLYEKTWPSLIKLNNIVHQVSIGGATSSDILRQCEYHIPFEPDIIIVQVGIVDCAPRFLKKIELEITRKVPFGYGKNIIKLLNNNIVRKYRNITYVSDKIFRSNVQNIIKYFEPKPVCFIGILPALPDYEKLLPRISNNIIKYNEILKEESSYYICSSSIDSEGIMLDYIHLNEKGHSFIYEKLVKFIKNI